MKIRKKELVDLYVGKRFSTTQISKFYSVSSETIRNYLIKYRIKRRRNCIAYGLRIKIPTDATDISYIAGIIDADGTITLSKSTNSIGGFTSHVSVKNTNKELILWLNQKIGGNVTKTEYDNHWKTAYRWYIYSLLSCKELIEAIMPFLIIKKKNALIVLKYIEKRLGIDRNKRHSEKDIETLKRIAKLVRKR